MTELLSQRAGLLGGEAAEGVQKLEAVRRDSPPVQKLQQQGQLPTLIEQLAEPDTIADGSAPLVGGLGGGSRGRLGAFDGSEDAVEQQATRMPTFQQELEAKQLKLAGWCAQEGPRAQTAIGGRRPEVAACVWRPMGTTPSSLAALAPIISSLLRPHLAISPSRYRRATSLPRIASQPPYLPTSLCRCFSPTPPHLASLSLLIRLSIPPPFVSRLCLWRATTALGQRSLQGQCRRLRVRRAPSAKAVGRMAARRVAQRVAEVQGGGAGGAAAGEAQGKGLVGELAEELANAYREDLKRGEEMGPLADLVDAVRGPTTRIASDLTALGQTINRALESEEAVTDAALQEALEGGDGGRGGGRSGAASDALAAGASGGADVAPSVRETN